MPLFEFVCETCGKKFEELLSIEKISDVVCACGSKEVKRLVSTFSSHVSSNAGCAMADFCAQNSPEGALPCSSGCAFHGK